MNSLIVGPTYPVQSKIPVTKAVLEEKGMAMKRAAARCPNRAADLCSAQTRSIIKSMFCSFLTEKVGG